MRAMVVTTVSAAALALTVAAGAAPVGGADVATGKGVTGACVVEFEPTFCLRPREFQFAATSTLQGGEAAGFYRHTTAVSETEGRVTCLTAVGNTAVFGGELRRRGAPSDEEPVEFLVYVVDNDVEGESDVPDLLSPFFFPGTLAQAEGQCLVPPVSPSGYLPVLEGDIRVRDGQLTTAP